MNKFVCLLVFVTVLEGVVHAEAPELRNVMPNSWKKVTRLARGEEERFLQENKELVEKIKELTSDMHPGRYTVFEHYLVYEQIVGTDTFYRILCTDNDNPRFSSSSVRFFQYLVYKGRLLYMAPYNHLEAYQSGINGYFYSIDIISDNNGAKGILITSLRTVRDESDPAQWGKGAYRKGQLWGVSLCTYYLMEDIITNGMTSDVFYVTENCSSIQITATECLVDPNIPFRYSLQNAFDGDPATSYVENTGDDLIIIRILVGGARKLAIINGYAQSQSLYYANNRVKKLIWPIEIELADNTLDYQFAEIPHGQELKTSELYSGNKFSDTCIAELNIKGEHGWLFGDIANE
jgi:hypothetical protein